jgi:hypothetical protein
MRSLGGKMVQNQREIQARLAELENMRVLLEEARAHARAIGDTEGERIEAEIETTLREVNRLMFDLGASLR